MKEMKIAETSINLAWLYDTLEREGRVVPLNRKDIEREEVSNVLSKLAVKFEMEYPNPNDYLNDLCDFAMETILSHFGTRKIITHVKFYNQKADVYVEVKMMYDRKVIELDPEQRCLAYDKLANITSEDFVSDCVITDFWDEKI